MTNQVEKIKVFGIGLSKTGTTSLAEALTVLGIKTIHYPHDATTYSELICGNYQLSILKKFQAICDISVSPYYAQLADTFPQSKFILTTRDEVKWLQSIKQHLQVVEEWRTKDRDFEQFTKFISAVVYGCLDFCPERYLFVYKQHIANVIDYFKGNPDRLLIMDITQGDGWEKLAPFLGLEIPDIPFIEKNSHVDMKSWFLIKDIATKELSEIIPSNSPFILVDKASIELESLKDNQPMLFFEHNDFPLSDDVAIRKLERLIAEGGEYIVFSWTSFWWLEHYDKLHDYIKSRFQCVLSNDRLIVFQLKV